MPNICIILAGDGEDIPVHRNRRVQSFLYSKGYRWANGEHRRLIHTNETRLLWLYEGVTAVGHMTFTRSADLTRAEEDNWRIIDFRFVPNEPIEVEEE